MCRHRCAHLQVSLSECAGPKCRKHTSNRCTDGVDSCSHISVSHRASNSYFLLNHKYIPLRPRYDSSDFLAFPLREDLVRYKSAGGRLLKECFRLDRKRNSSRHSLSSDISHHACNPLHPEYVFCCRTRRKYICIPVFRPFSRQRC